MADTSDQQAATAREFNDRVRQDRVRQAGEEQTKPLSSSKGQNSGQRITAQILQKAWWIYIPSFTLSSLYIVFHYLCRYVFHFQAFCKADQGSPLAAMGQVTKVAGAANVKVPGLGSSGASEGLWIGLGLASIAPIVLMIVIILGIGDAINHPARYAGCSLKGIGVGAVSFSVGEGVDEFMSCVLSK
jgi:hypothetical protein